MKIVLEESDFTTLVYGGVVKQNGVEIILSDIGYSLMIAIINEEQNNR